MHSCYSRFIGSAFDQVISNTSSIRPLRPLPAQMLKNLIKSLSPVLFTILVIQETNAQSLGCFLGAPGFPNGGKVFGIAPDCVNKVKEAGLNYYVTIKDPKFGCVGGGLDLCCILKDI